MSTKQTEQCPTPIRCSAAFVLHLCHRLSRQKATDLANITQSDVCEMEKYRP